MLNSIDEKEFQGKNPYIIAAALIYLANKKISNSIKVKPVLSLKDIARVCNLKHYSIMDNASYIAIER
jgi:hypothetical protein